MPVADETSAKQNGTERQATHR